jgi:hypothetical protein
VKQVAEHLAIVELNGEIADSKDANADDLLVV